MKTDSLLIQRHLQLDIPTLCSGGLCFSNPKGHLSDIMFSDFWWHSWQLSLSLKFFLPWSPYAICCHFYQSLFDDCLSWLVGWFLFVCFGLLSSLVPGFSLCFFNAMFKTSHLLSWFNIFIILPPRVLNAYMSIHISNFLQDVPAWACQI